MKKLTEFGKGLAKRAADSMPSAETITNAASKAVTGATYADVFGAAKRLSTTMLSGNDAARAKLDSVAASLAAAANQAAAASGKTSKALKDLADPMNKLDSLMSLSQTMALAQSSLAAMIAVSPDLRVKLTAVNDSLQKLKTLPADAKDQTAESLRALTDNLQAFKQQAFSKTSDVAGEVAGEVTKWILEKLFEIIIEAVLKSMLENTLGTGAELVSLLIPELGLLEILLCVLF